MNPDAWPSYFQQSVAALTPEQLERARELLGRFVVNRPPIQGRSYNRIIVDDLPAPTINAPREPTSTPDPLPTARDVREMSQERYRRYRDLIRNNAALLYGGPLQHVCDWCGERCGARPIRVHDKRACNACLDLMHVGDDDEDVFAPLDIRF